MYEKRQLGAATLELYKRIQSQVSFSDFCLPAGTIEFDALDGFLRSSLTLFKLSYRDYELEAKVRDGMVFIRRNGFYQHSTPYTGNEPYHVAIQWDADSIGCGAMPVSANADTINHHMRAVATPITHPPHELIQLLRSENLLFNEAYKNVDDVFGSVRDCLHLCQADIRRHGAEKFIWGKGGNPNQPIDEPEISRFVASFLTIHGGTRNFDVICEPIAGTGNVDFYVVAPILGANLAKIVIEAKKADSPKLTHGLQVQLPEYMARVGTDHGIYLTYWLKSATYPYPSQLSYALLEIELLHEIPRPEHVRTIAIDLSLGATPSRQPFPQA